MKFVQSFALLLTLMVTPLVNAVDNPPEAVTKALHIMFGDVDMQHLEIKQLPDLDLFEIVDTAKIDVFYISSNGRYLIQGNSIYDIQQQGLDITDNRKNALRLKALADVKDKDTIIFKPKTKPKHVVNVFTDVDCFYCSKLHREINDFNQAGIEIRYLGFPRAGLKSPTYRKMKNVWCAKDQKKAMTDAKAGLKVEKAECETKIPQQYKLGQQIGVTGTPALVLPNGELLPGYMPAKRLLRYLDQIE